jgi:hypothetical protein
MKTDRELWVAYCRKRWKSKPLIDDENTIECLKVAYKIGCADGFDSGVKHGYNIGFKEGKKRDVNESA